MENKWVPTKYEAESRRSSGGFFGNGSLVAVALMAVCRFNFTYEGLVALVTGLMLVRIAIVDAMTMKIPNRYICALLIPSVMSMFMLRLGLWERMEGFFIISVPMYLCVAAIPGSFGGGDIKLVAVTGFLLGMKGIALAAFLGILTGGCYAIWLLASGRAERKSHFAFGPFLVFGIWISMLYGDSILVWYFSFLW